MSSTIQVAYGTLQTLTVSGLNSLAAGSAAFSSAVSNTTLLADDYLIECVIADITESGDQQVLVVAVSSLDGTNFSDITQQSNWRRIGYLAIIGTGPFRMPAGSLAQAFGGVVPPSFKIGVFNDAGASLASSGNSVTALPITFTAS